MVRPMLSDRPYMRATYPRERTSVLTWLLCSLIAGFLVQLAAGGSWPGGGNAFQQQFSLTVPGVRSGHLWTLITHSFLHDSRYFFHALGSLMMIFLFGRELLPLLGTRRFLLLYFGSLVLGALTWTAVHWR